MDRNGQQRFRALHTIAVILANLTAVLSANYIVFYILDHYNTGLHFAVHTEFFLGKYLHIAVLITMLLTGLLYLLLYVGGGLKRAKFRIKWLIIILIIDVVAAGAIAMAINVYTFDWLNLRNGNMDNGPVAIGTPTPKATPEATEIPTPDPVVTPTPEQAETTPVPVNPGETAAPETPTPEPTEVPTPTPEPTEVPTPTPDPGLLGEKYEQYKDKFSDGDPVVTEPNTTETLADGTECTLIYTYAGKNAAVELRHYKKGKLEYQIADVYVLSLDNLFGAYVDTQGNKKMIQVFARECNAIIAINSDYFTANAIGEGLIIRNGYLVRNNKCKYSDLCVVYQDGTVRCFDCKQDTIDNNEIINSYPFHSFYFGPSLLDAEGNAKTKFNSTLGQPNPRTAFGYYEPGHYAFISILGDRSIKDINGHGHGDGKSPGMTLAELSSLCASMGMKAAYNFDGGGSSGMYWNETLFGHNSRETGDILAIVD